MGRLTLKLTMERISVATKSSPIGSKISCGSTSNDTMKTTSTEAERAAEQQTRNIERYTAYRIKLCEHYLERMSKNPAFLKVQAD